MSNILLAIHGGAGSIEQALLGTHSEAVCREALGSALTAGYQVLQSGGSALDVVELAVKLLEDCEEFNAGRGSALTSAGTVEMDAAIMDGSSRRAGAVAAVKGIKNPVCAARAVMEHSPHVLLVGEGAEIFARGQGIETADRDYFIMPECRAQLKRARASRYVAVDHAVDKHGTVGAVARDAYGNLAAATSTGGMINKLPGRVGDSPLIGAGIWADNTCCAVSATGHGETLIRTVFAHEVDALIRYKDLDVRSACAHALEQVRDMGFNGGCVAVDKAGNVALPFNTQGMYRGWIGGDGKTHVAIFAGET